VFYAASFDAMNELVAFLTENCCAADCGPACTPVVACKPVKMMRSGRSAKKSEA